MKHFGWPAFNTSQVASMIRWLMAIVFIAGVVWAIGLLRKRKQPAAENEPAGTRESEMAKDASLVVQSTANPHSN